MDFAQVTAIASLMVTLCTLFGVLMKIVSWINRQKEQDKEIKEIRNEQKIITVGVLACLKGLSEQGCDGPVHEAITMIENYQIEKAHK